jgi:hypothetical protein
LLLTERNVALGCAFSLLAVSLSTSLNFTAHGDIIHKTYKEEFPNEGTLTAFNTNFNPNTGTKGALEFF